MIWPPQFLFRLQISLTYPPSPYGPLSGPTDLACAPSLSIVFPLSPLPIFCHSRDLSFIVIPAKAGREGKGIHRSFGPRIAYGQWMPAFAGMTMCGDRGPIYAHLGLLYLHLPTNSIPQSGRGSSSSVSRLPSRAGQVWGRLQYAPRVFGREIRLPSTLQIVALT